MKFLARRLTALAPRGARQLCFPLNLLRSLADPISKARRPNRAGIFARSNEHQVDQRENGRSNRGSDQRVIGTDVRVGLDRRLRAFVGHASRFRAAQKRFV